MRTLASEPRTSPALNFQLKSKSKFEHESPNVSIPNRSSQLALKIESKKIESALKDLGALVSELHEVLGSCLPLRQNI